MTVPQTFDPFDSIATDSAGLADAAAGNLTAAVAQCPGWSVADLVRHLLGALAEGAQPLTEPVRVQADDAGLTWTLVPADGLLTWRRGPRPAATAVCGTASDLLLWLYGRRCTDELAVTGALGSAHRVRAYTATD